jgi:membrane-bound ClpP family serine protease
MFKNYNDLQLIALGIMLTGVVLMSLDVLGISVHLGVLTLIGLLLGLLGYLPRLNKKTTRE